MRFAFPQATNNILKTAVLPVKHFASFFVKDFPPVGMTRTDAALSPAAVSDRHKASRGRTDGITGKV